MAELLRIRDWSIHFENNRTRELKYLNWVPIPNRLDGSSFRELADHKEGPAHFGVWIVMVEIASRCDPRGSLMRSNGKALSFDDMSRMCGFTPKIISDAATRLISIGWIERICVENGTASQEGATLGSQEGAGLSHDSDAFLILEGNGIEHKSARSNGEHRFASIVDEIYQLYPRKVAKGAAVKAIEKAIKNGADPAVLHSAVAEFAKSEKGRDRQFCPHPATWFNQRRWEDDQATWNPSERSLEDRIPTDEDLANYVPGT